MRFFQKLWFFIWRSFWKKSFWREMFLWEPFLGRHSLRLFPLRLIFKSMVSKFHSWVCKKCKTQGRKFEIDNLNINFGFYQTLRLFLLFQSLLKRQCSQRSTPFITKLHEIIFFLLNEKLMTWRNWKWKTTLKLLKSRSIFKSFISTFHSWV